MYFSAESLAKKERLDPTTSTLIWKRYRYSGWNAWLPISIVIALPFLLSDLGYFEYTPIAILLVHTLLVRLFSAKYMKKAAEEQRQETVSAKRE